MTRYRLAPGANGVEFSRDGEIDARGNRRHGAVIEVTDHDREKAMDNACRIQEIAHPIGFAAPPGTPGHICKGCGFHLWTWQDRCPKCAYQVKEEEVHD